MIYISLNSFLLQCDIYIIGGKIIINRKTPHLFFCVNEKFNICYPIQFYVFKFYLTHLIKLLRINYRP